MANNSQKTEVMNDRYIYKKHTFIGETGIKVTVHIPDNAPNRQRKINRIYDILKRS